MTASASMALTSEQVKAINKACSSRPLGPLAAEIRCTAGDITERLVGRGAWPLTQFLRLGPALGKPALWPAAQHDLAFLLGELREVRAKERVERYRDAHPDVRSEVAREIRRLAALEPEQWPDSLLDAARAVAEAGAASIGAPAAKSTLDALRRRRVVRLADWRCAREEEGGP